MVVTDVSQGIADGLFLGSSSIIHHELRKLFPNNVGRFPAEDRFDSTCRGWDVRRTRYDEATIISRDT
jgi:hypothetical protein